MSEIKKGVFIRWNGFDDEGGEIMYTGKVTSNSKGRISFRSSIGRITVAEDDGTFVVMKQPKGWKEEEKAPTSLPATTPKKEKVVKPSEPKELKGKLKEVVKLLKGDGPNDIPKTRKEAIKLIVDSGLMGAAGASTYWNNAKKHL